MLQILLLALSFVNLVLCEDPECNFTPDCKKVQKCQNIADAGCICNFGRCQFEGNPFFRNTECQTFKDCACKETPENCFCYEGACREERFECHEKSDCKKLEKCKDKDCACSGHTCEFDCATKDDCVKNNFYCSSAIGYQCKCEDSLCEFEAKPKQCETIKDCVEKGQCKADQGCSCTNYQCVKPWYHDQKFRQEFPKKNCRSEQDCEFHILQCQGGKCACKNEVKVNEYNTWGECVLN